MSCEASSSVYDPCLMMRSNSSPPPKLEENHSGDDAELPANSPAREYVLFNDEVGVVWRVVHVVQLHNIRVVQSKKTPQSSEEGE